MDKENQTSAQQLAEEISTALVAAKLIEATRKDELVERMLSGEISSDDWTLLVDKAAELAGKEFANGQ